MWTHVRELPMSFGLTGFRTYIIIKTVKECFISPTLLLGKDGSFTEYEGRQLYYKEK